MAWAGEPGPHQGAARGAPGILGWALDGLDRLTQLGRSPSGAVDAVTTLQDIASPTSAFIRDCCEVRADLEVPVADLFDAWKTWCEEERAGPARHRAGVQQGPPSRRARCPSGPPSGRRQPRTPLPRPGTQDQDSQWRGPRTTADRRRGPRWSAAQPIVVPGRYRGRRVEPLRPLGPRHAQPDAGRRLASPGVRGGVVNRSHTLRTRRARRRATVRSIRRARRLARRAGRTE